jgi:hypothetical protein
MRTKIAAVAVVLGAVGGCASLDRVRAPALEGGPDSSAVVVARVEARMRGYRDNVSTLEVTGGTLTSTDDGKRIDATAVDGYVVFSGIAPGTYVLTDIRGLWKDSSFTAPTSYLVPQDPAYVVALRAGELRFIGVISIEDARTPRERSVNFDLKPSQDAEAATWRWFTGVYARNAWAEPARRRLAELGR